MSSIAVPRHAPAGRLRLLFVLLLAAGAGCDPSRGEGGREVQSPAPPGSRLPGLSSDARGRLILSWVEPRGDGHALVYSSLAEDGWEAPITVAQGTGWFVNWADVPSVTALGEDFWAAHWRLEQGGGMYAYDILLSLSRDGGVTWSDPFRPHLDGTPTEHGFVSLWPAHLPGGDSGVGAVWLDGRNTLIDASRTVADEPRTMLQSAVFDSHGRRQSAAVVDERVCDCCQTDVAKTAQGPLVVYRDRSEGEVRDVRAARAGTTGWQPLEPVSQDGWIIDGCPVNGPALDTLGGTTAVAWHTEAGGDRRVQVAFLADDASGSWSPAQVADAAEPLGRVDVAVLEDGDAAVSWLAPADDPGHAWILLARVGRNGVAGKPLRVAATEASRPAGFPRLIAHGEGLLVAWTRWRDGVPQVVTSRVELAALAEDV